MTPTLLAVEIGGTKTQAAVGDAEGRLLEVRRERVDLERGRDGILTWLAEATPDLARAWAERGRPPAAVGVGFGGPVDVRNGAALVSHQVEGWTGFPLRDWFVERVGVPCVVENDSNAAGWAEYRAGAGAGAGSMVYMNIGSGIGGALIAEGRLHNPQGIGGGDIGHTWVPVPEGGVRGADKLEHFCSGWSIEARARRNWTAEANSPLGRLCGGRAEAITCAHLAAAAVEGDAFARGIIDQTADVLAYAVANVITLYCPERFVIGGGVALMGEALLAPLRERVDERVIGPYRGRCAIVPAALKQDVVLVGALLLAAEAAKGAGDR